MSDDLVKRLYDAANGPYDMTAITGDLIEAGETIENLMRQNAALREGNRDLQLHWDVLKSDYDTVLSRAK